MNTFFELIQVAIGRREALSRPPRTREEWTDLCAVCGKHNLLGITFPVIDQLHDTDETLPLGVYSRWAMVKEKIGKKNVKLQEYCHDLYKQFLADGFRSCVLKGQAVAALYPDPLLRQSGDIDLWVDGDRQTLVDYLRARCEVHKVVYHHCDTKLLPKVGVEVHFTPSWMNAPRANKRLQDWFDSVKAEQFANYDESAGFCVPTIRFNAVYILVHIYRHVLEEGVGLRQLLDYYYVLIHMDENDRTRARRDLEQLRLDSFAASVMYVLKEVFLMDEKELFYAPDARGGRFLLDEILQSGNFGRFDERNAHKKGEGLVAHGKRKVSRGLRYLFRYPSEVLFMPVFIVWQYFWRRKRGYLYKGR